MVTPKPRATPRARPSFHPRNADNLGPQQKPPLTSTKAPTKTRGAPHYVRTSGLRPTARVIQHRPRLSVKVSITSSRDDTRENRCSDDRDGEPLIPGPNGPPWVTPHRGPAALLEETNGPCEHVLDRAYRQRQRIQGGMAWLADSGGRAQHSRQDGASCVLAVGVQDSRRIGRVNDRDSRQSMDAHRQPRAESLPMVFATPAS